MTKDQALDLLLKEDLMISDKPLRLNKGITQSQGVNIVLKCVQTLEEKEILEGWLEKRVLQVTKNIVRIK